MPPRTPRAPLPGSTDADVCIVGAGFTGLWTAYYLKRLQPDLRIVVLEQRFAGFGASGRNGGWLTNSVTAGRARYAASHGRDAAIAQQLAMNRTVDEVIAVASAERIEADIHKGGEVNIALNAAQEARLRAEHSSEASWPYTDVELWERERMTERIGVDGVRAGLWHPHCARIHPAKLVAGLAEAVERLGVVIHESTHVREILPGLARTGRGDVRAAHVLRATEGFTARLRGERRTWLPLNSSLIVTDPLPQSFWDQVGWAGRETLGDFAHVYMYAQRTADDRIAFGGRGVPYRFGSRVDDDGTTQASTVQALTALLRRFFPAASEVPVAHAWSGVLGVPRDWAATVGLDDATGLGWAGGYVGTGVATTNLAGRTLADMVLRRDTELTRLPWVDHRVRRWEPEPLRWLGVSGMYAAYRYADRVEARGGARTSPVARVADVIVGH
ncbi:FAD-binding oxidoreductase [Demequina capsici]|uniref:FAD-binding oxidoreductase n=1 Tax=Demequina capsici TaxID=3075620 RepID=A0AA96FFB1_9MICO|nr:FAD-binding oxidoreductase [Demequina sp. PMTSA13]WNM28883.1 FAD-binding oxidoreductase [Demequina sp. PMTSA13]